MNLQDRIEILALLGKQLQQPQALPDAVIHRACYTNLWFTPQNIQTALTAIATQFLNRRELETWLSAYPAIAVAQIPKTVGLVMAGNIPLVGWHDFMCVFVCGYKAMVKLSSKDEVLFTHLLQLMVQINPDVQNYVAIVQQLKDFDAVIATGSNNSARYFEYYFGKLPHIIRKNRSSVAILTGSETPEEITRLGNDIFEYFGLGCRNVSKLMAPKGYDFARLLSLLEPYGRVMQHNKYKNNYDYHYSVFLLNKQLNYASDFLILQENPLVASPVSVVHYEFYTSAHDLQNKLAQQQDQIQCITAAHPTGTAIPFGSAQQPRLWDYADGVDTMQFLTAGW